MNVLILSCNTGGGHNSCAKAIAAELQSRGHACRIDDALAYVSEGTSRFVSNWHVRFYRYFPKLYNKGYAYAGSHPAFSFLFYLCIDVSIFHIFKFLHDLIACLWCCK